MGIMTPFPALALACLALVQGVTSLSPAQWRTQSIYQVMTDRFARTDLSTTYPCNPDDGIHCGGTWKGLVSKLDYIQNMGFTAVWISPVVKQMEGNTTDGSSYHGYWAEDIWALNPAFGTAEDLVCLSEALHERGMYLMVDVVTNHYAYDGNRTSVDYSLFNPFNSASYFHPQCETDYKNQSSVERCWEGDNIVSLPDLRTEDDDVRAVFNSWIKSLVANYSIDGLRVDSVAHVETSFWEGFEEAADVYMVGEIHDGDPAYVFPYQKYMDGVMDYPSYWWITEAFQSTSGSITKLVSGMNTLKNTAVDSSLLGSFLENHDRPRFANYTSDMALAKNAIAFTMLKDGIPIVYQGQEQRYSGGNYPSNREAVWLTGYDASAPLYGWIASLNKLRSQAISDDAGYVDYKAQVVYSTASTIAMRKGNSGSQIVGVFTNTGSAPNATTITTVPLASSSTGFTPHQQLVEVMGCKLARTDANGNLAVVLIGGMPQIFYPLAKLKDSEICSCATAELPLDQGATKLGELVTQLGVTIGAAINSSVGEASKWLDGLPIKLIGDQK